MLTKRARGSLSPPSRPRRVARPVVARPAVARARRAFMQCIIMRAAVFDSLNYKTLS